jgi:hypothetical protein
MSVWIAFPVSELGSCGSLLTVPVKWHYRYNHFADERSVISVYELSVWCFHFTLNRRFRCQVHDSTDDVERTDAWDYLK